MTIRIELEFDNALDAGVLMDILTDRVRSADRTIGEAVDTDFAIAIAKRQFPIAERCRQEVVRQIVEQT